MDAVLGRTVVALGSALALVRILGKSHWTSFDMSSRMDLVELWFAIDLACSAYLLERDTSVDCC